MFRPQQDVPRRSSCDVREVNDSSTRRGPGSRDGLRHSAIAVLVQTLTRPPYRALPTAAATSAPGHRSGKCLPAPPPAGRYSNAARAGPHLRFIAPPAKREFGIIPCSMVVHSYIVRGRRDSFWMPATVPAPNVPVEWEVRLSRSHGKGSERQSAFHDRWTQHCLTTRRLGTSMAGWICGEGYLPPAPHLREGGASIPPIPCAPLGAR